MKTKRNYKSLENFQFNKRVLRENVMKENPREKSFWNERHSSSARELAVLELHELEIISLLRKRARAKRSITRYNMVRSSA